jgi:phage shock protein A
LLFIKKAKAMGLLSRIGMIIRSFLNDLVNKAEDPEKILEQSVNDMQDELVQMRQAVAQAIAAMKRQEQQYLEADKQATEWERRAMLALQKGQEDLAREALVRRKSQAETASTLKESIDRQSGQVTALKKNLIAIEGKIGEAKTKKEMLKARIQSAKAQENLNNILGKVSTSSVSGVIERMEEKVLMAEAKASATSELGMDEVENRFKQLEQSNVDEDLAALKAKMITSVPTTPALEASNSSSVDTELEALRKELGH